MAISTLRRHRGRGWNNLSDAYRLPADSAEHERLNLQHEAMSLVMGGLCPMSLGDLDDILLSKDIEKPLAILDLGCGSGIWPAQMAEVYPEARVVGFDLAKSASSSIVPIPSNCSFVQGDLTKGLSPFREQFDLVHARAVVGHLPVPVQRKAILEAIRCLRPGGLFILIDGDSTLLDENKQPVRLASGLTEETNPSHSWMGRILAIISGLAWKPGYLKEILYSNWLATTANLDPDTIQSATFLSPIGWCGDEIEDGEEIGKMMYADMMAAFESARPMLTDIGIGSDAYETLRVRVEEEASASRLKLYFQWHAVWGRKLNSDS